SSPNARMALLPVSLSCSDDTPAQPSRAVAISLFQRVNVMPAWVGTVLSYEYGTTAGCQRAADDELQAPQPSPLGWPLASMPSHRKRNSCCACACDAPTTIAATTATTATLARVIGSPSS